MTAELPLGPTAAGWEKARLEELAEFITKGSTPTTYGFGWVTEGVLFLRSECVSEKGFQLEGSQFISNEAHKALARSSIRGGDLLVTITGNVGRAAFFPEDLPEANINQHIARIRIADRERADPRFVLHVLGTQKYRRYFERIVTGLAYPQISLAQVRETLVPLPPLGEQRKIASILSSVDEAIEATQAVIDQLQVVKKAMMAELLTRGLPGRHTRFKQTEIGEVPEEWEVVCLREIIGKMDAGWSPRCDGEPAAPHEWGVLKTTSVVWEGWDDSQSKRLPPALEPRPWLEVQADDVLVTRAGPGDRVGVVVHVRATRHRLMISDKIIRLRAGEAVTPAFLALALGTDGAQEYLVKRKTGLAASQVNLSQSILEACPVPLPPLNEQADIVRAFELVGMRYRAECAALQALHETKRSLMSVLLTGEVRVQPDEEAA